MYPKRLSDIADGRIRARVAVERRIVKRIVDACLAAGHALATNQGEGQDANVPAIPTRDRKTIIDALAEVDDEFLGVFANDDRQPFGWVRFVYGNDGYDVVSDYTVNLETLVDPIVNDAANEEENN